MQEAHVPADPAVTPVAAPVGTVVRDINGNLIGEIRNGRLVTLKKLVSVVLLAVENGIMRYQVEVLDDVEEEEWSEPAHRASSEMEGQLQRGGQVKWDSTNY